MVISRLFLFKFIDDSVSFHSRVQLLYLLFSQEAQKCAFTVDSYKYLTETQDKISKFLQAMN